MNIAFVIRFRVRVLFVALVLTCSAFGLQSAAQQAISSNGEKPVAIKVLEIGKVNDRAMKRALENFRNVYDPTIPVCIINYGNDKEIARREKLITDIRWPQPWDKARITLVHGGRGKGPKTVIWKVPYGAEDPKP